MNKTIVRNGLFSMVVLVGTGYLNFLINGTSNYARQEVFGYLTILLSTVFVFFGIKQYRDKVNGGFISYWKGMQVGFLILLFPAIAFGLFDILYMKYLDPGFMEKYYNYSKLQMQASMPPARYQAWVQEMEQQKAMFGNLYFQFAIMALTVLMLGIVVTAISSLILYKKQRVSNTQ